jgi:hypothetical protein
MSHDDFPDPIAPLARPTSTRAKHPAHIATRILKRHAVIVERADQTEVVKHRRNIKQLSVIRDPTQLTEAG